MAKNTATLQEVEAFLNEFKAKAKVFGIVYNMLKEENALTLMELEMSPNSRDEYILGLTPQDYYQGPDDNLDNPEEGDVWMFGIGIKRRRKVWPIYIKIYVTKRANIANYCISFHIAKFPMTFPYKTKL